MTRSENPEHITIEQLSAFLDQQLTPQEQATVDAHLHTCEQCRLALADLRATVALVRAMPQPALPRSFTLPANVTPFPVQPASELHRAANVPARRQPAARNGLRRSLRFVSAIAATLGLLIVLSGLWNAISPGIGGGASESAAFTTAGQAPSVSPRASTPGIAVGTNVVTQPGSTASGQQRQTKTPVPQPQQTGTPRQGVLQDTGGGHTTQQPPAPFVLPSYLDLGTIEGRLSLGLALALLGIIGLLVTRRRYHRAI
ncbi:MAG TPA: zf-HC2 domain-containing protein [Ktedonobacteraceae bacterium]|nr:zf-HC2 domain-containing protein [Ktedonobacteraceae bacterium]